MWESRPPTASKETLADDKSGSVSARSYYFENEDENEIIQRRVKKEKEHAYW